MTTGSLGDVATALEAALAGPARGRIVAEVSKSRSFDRSVRHLRDGMRVHRFEGAGETLFDGSWVKRADTLTRKDGFHVLHDWDGKADRFRDETIPAEVADLVARVADPKDAHARRHALALLVDYYFLYVLALLALRAWDETDPNAALDRVDGLLRHLQGPDGSGQKLASGVATLIFIATSHFEPDVGAYEALLANIRKLDARHRLGFARTHAAILGGHLRFGLEVTCAGNVADLRLDNVPDYPWLSHALATLLADYAARGHAPDAAAERRRTVEALFLALTPDSDAFLSDRTPEPLSSCAEERETVRTLLVRHRSDLLKDFEALRPETSVYSPLSFTFNFPHNLVKGAVLDGVLRGSPWTVGLDELISSPRPGEDSEARSALAATLTRYALATPDMIRGQPHPAIVYHPEEGQRAFDRTMARLERRD